MSLGANSCMGNNTLVNGKELTQQKEKKAAELVGSLSPYLVYSLAYSLYALWCCSATSTYNLNVTNGV